MTSSVTGATGGSAGPAALRPLGTSELLDGAFRLVARRARVVLPLALPFALLAAVLDTLLAVPLAGRTSDAAGLPLADLLARVAVSTVVGVLLGGVLTPVVVADALGRPVRAADVGRRLGGRGAGALVVLAVVVAVAETAGLVALVAGGVWLWGAWALAAPALAEERLGPVGALRRSFALTRGLFWRTWGIRALGWVAATLLGLLVTLPAELLSAAVADADPFDPGAAVTTASLAITAAGALLVGVLLTPVLAVLDARLYLDARVRREGLDLVLAVRAVRAGAAA